AIGLIRMSGPEALSIALRAFRPRGSSPLAERKVVYGYVIDPETDRVLDDGLLVFLKAPRSYTGEDMVELTLHGSPVMLNSVLRILMALGARLATRGEFTRRALLNGKLDLLQAEAVIDLIDAQSEAAAREARSRLDSSPAPRMRELSDAIKGLLAAVEAHLDFDEDDELGQPDFTADVRDLLARMEAIRRDSQEGVLLREGIRVCIAGKPNVGKSTLFNALLRKDRAIVTPIPGATRDPLEDRIILKGHLFALWDTAGIREPEGPIEDEGIKRTIEAIGRSDLVIAVLDATSGLDELDKEVLATCESRRMVIAANKIDLVQGRSPLDVLAVNPVCPAAWVSAKTGQGIDTLEQILTHEAEHMTQRQDGDEEKVVLSGRCLHLLDAATAPLKRLLEMVQGEHSPKLDIVSYELRTALAPLEEITGEKVDEGVLDRLFERFCVGK
ncbi:MAG: tRNA uridine-5-carboxymethylaminomethyl(34) synthesis GTPase MnmE, partial [Desulfomonilaceae bacterium]